jgi:hypothetical protein
MRNVRMIRREPLLVSIPVEGAVYCENCERVSNSTNFRCGVCGSEAILSLRLLIDGPQADLDRGRLPLAASFRCSSSKLRQRLRPRAAALLLNSMNDDSLCYTIE